MTPRIEKAPHGFTLAAGFLTAIPLRPAAPRPGDLGRAGAWFPTVGLVLGVVLSLAYWLLGQVFAPALAAALTVALWAALTGGLHLDGLADCGDGLLAAVSPERRLEIMRDPRLGAFGGLSLVLFVSLKILALAGLSAGVLWQASLPGLRWQWTALLPFGPLLLAPVIARWLILIAARQPAARPGGLGHDFAAGLSRRTFVLAALLPIALTFLGGPRALLAAFLAHLVAWAALRTAQARLGGVTGDVLGLTVELAELTLLLTYAAGLPDPLL